MINITYTEQPYHANITINKLKKTYKWKIHWRGRNKNEKTGERKTDLRHYLVE